ncbi:MAG: hypothetical protein R3B68_07195 [Phycisphaerales bacterium]
MLSFVLGAATASLIAYATWRRQQEAKAAEHRVHDPRFPQEIGM